jgi:hypothetical protein
MDMFICCNVRKQTNSNADISEMVRSPVLVVGATIGLKAETEHFAQLVAFRM